MCARSRYVDAGGSAPISDTKAGTAAVYRDVTNLMTFVWSAVAALVGIGLLFAAARLDDHSAGHAVLNDLGGVIVASVALAVFWELVVRRRFAREIAETVGVGSDIANAGLTHIGMRYLKDLNWEQLIADAHELDIFVTYGATWRNTYHDELHALAATKPDAKIRVFLPDPRNASDMAVLCQRYSMTDRNLISNIEDAHTFYQALAQVGGASVTIYQRSGVPSFSCYRIDALAVVTLYSHKKERTAVPTLVCEKSGSLYDFVMNELQAIQDQSTTLTEPPPTTLGSDRARQADQGGRT